MIPLLLTLKNFLSYREASLDFRGLHVACVCGANGAGKSSLLEAIAWSVWGESRAVAEDDVIHQGEMETRVDFTFAYRQQTYRVIRTRMRGQSSSLEFQVETPQGFRPLTERGMRATQQLILQHLRLDYETFVNSAYLRQGRADEFMLKRPAERKQILADLLKLDQYDTLAEQAKERSRQLKAELDVLDRSLERTNLQLQQGEGLAAEQDALGLALAAMQQQHEADSDALRHLQNSRQQRQAWTQQLSLHQQQDANLRQDCQRLQQELHTTQQQQWALEEVLKKAGAIAAGYAQFHSLQTEDDIQSAKFHAHQSAQAKRQQLQQQFLEQVSALKDQQAKLQAHLESLQQQGRDLQHGLKKADDIETAVETLRQARTTLIQFEQLQGQAAPLLQRRQQLQTQVDRVQARLTARLDELRTTQRQIQTQLDRQPHLQRALLEIASRIDHLEQRRLYQNQLREKGMERRTFMERLQERQREFETQLAELDHKILMLRRESGVGEVTAGMGTGDALLELLQQQEAVGSSAIATNSATNVTNDLTNGLIPGLLPGLIPNDSSSEDDTGTTKRKTKTKSKSQQVTGFETSASQLFPPCPLCDRPLDEHHWHRVLEHHQTERQEILNQLWVIREQLAVSDREIQVLRQEYRTLEKELAQSGEALEQRGKLLEQLQGVTSEQGRLQLLQQEQAELERSLHTNEFAPDLHDELRLLDETLAHLNYDDRNHALARGEVDRWRWAEIKHAELKQAQKRSAQILKQQPELEAQIADLDQRIADLGASPLQRQIDELDQHLGAIAYDLKQHTALRNALRQAQSWQLRHQELLQAQQQYPQLQQRVKQLGDLLSERTQALQTLSGQIAELVSNVQQNPDTTNALHQLETQMQQRRTQMDEQLAHLGRLQQQQQHLAELSTEYATLSTQLQLSRRQLRVHQELGQAFGKNGIQALMIENVLPQLEAETNQILGQITNHQLHVQFVTQRSRRRGNAANTKMIDTLDILIADAQGTRPYETYSGGEAFRINFAIRLALARLLAQRSGTALQLLIVDEGFGTQDDVGCDRLISAIQAIASDFACILTVTHMPRFKEAFQTHVEVFKTDQGSQLRLSF